MNNTINNLMCVPTVSNILPHTCFLSFCGSLSLILPVVSPSSGWSVFVSVPVSQSWSLSNHNWLSSVSLSFPSLWLSFSFLNPLKATPLWHFTLKRLNMHLLKKQQHLFAVFITYLSPYLTIPEKINKPSVLCIVPTQITFIVPQIYFTCMLFLHMCAN